MTHISFTHHHASTFINDDDFDVIKEKMYRTHEALHQRTGLGNKYLGWVDYPSTYDKSEFLDISRAANKIQQNSEILLVIGVGGSYLGARAAIEMLNHSFNNLLCKEKRGTPQIIFVGHHLSSTYICELFDLLEEKEFSINIISKSGTTTEPAIAFRIFKNFLEKKYGKEQARQRIYVTTDKEKGALRTLAQAEKYATFVIPDSIGGRYSVLTAVGLLPIAVSGVMISDIMHGAEAAMHDLKDPNINNNGAYQYAVTRNILYNQGKKIEILVNYDTRLQYFGEWWKQLFGESEGKNNRGIFPSSANYTTDLHSLGQYIQDGERNFFQTILFVNEPKKDVKLEKIETNFDNLNYLSGKTIHEINKHAYEGALVAHKDGNVPNLIINIPKLDAYTFGYIVYFFLKACAISGYLLGVNPFDQPGVEAYKNNMFALLNKPGYKKESSVIAPKMNKVTKIF